MMNILQLSKSNSIKPGESLGSVFLEQVEKSPDNLAVKDRNKALSYSQLYSFAISLTSQILKHKVSQDKPVALLMSKSCDQIASILAVLNCGLIYVSIDTAYPYQRMSYVLEELEPELLIADDEWGDIANRLSEGKCRVLHVGDNKKDQNKRLPIQPRGVANTPACIIYTSGSSGEPKGVIHSHKNILHLAKHHIRDLGITETDHVSLLGSICHVSGITDLFRGLLCGAAVHLYDINKDNIVGLAEWIEKEKITIYHSVPTVFRFLVKSLGDDRNKLPLMRVVHLGGERMVQSDVLLFKKAFSDSCVLMNNLGCSELSSYRNCTFTRESHVDSDVIPAGYAVEGKNVIIVDQQLTPVALGEIGEICLVSDYLALGYWRRDDLTEQAFVEIDGDSFQKMYRTGDIGYLDEMGCLHHLGRKDNQVKIRGHRIELAEIEECLKKHEGIDFAVIKPSLQGEEQVLDAFLVPTPQYADTISGHLKFTLPNGMRIVHQNSVETAHLYENCFLEQPYLKNGISVKDNDCVVDVGANIGMFSLSLASCIKGVKLYGFEPIPETYEKLCINASLFIPNARTFNLGLAEREGIVDFLYYPMQSTMSCQGELAEETIDKALLKKHFQDTIEKANQTLLPSKQDQQKIVDKRMEAKHVHCRLTTLSQIIETEKIEIINLLKIDAQRSELKILQGISEIHWPRIKQIVMEVHDEKGGFTEGNREIISRLLETKGFQVIIDQEEFRYETGRYLLYAKRSTDKDTSCEISREFNPKVHPQLMREELVAHCQKFLPSYMVPVNFVFMDKIPLSTSGKILYANLEVPKDYGHQGYEAPESDIEVRLAKIWSKILNRSPIGRNDSFFEIGGHSLAAMELIGDIENEFSVILDFPAIYGASTIEKMAALLEDGESIQSSGVLHEMYKAERSRNIFFIHTLGGETIGYATLARCLGEHFNSYGLRSPRLVESEGGQAEHVEVMASKFIDRIRAVQKSGPYYIGGACFGGMLAYEIGLQLQKEGYEVGAILLLDPPNSPQFLTKKFKPIFLRNCIRLLSGKIVDYKFMAQLHPQVIKFCKWSAKQRLKKLGNPTVVKANRHSRDVYNPATTNMDGVHFFWANRSVGRKKVERHDPYLGWNDVVANLKIHELDCSHQDILGADSSQKILKHFLNYL